MMAGLGYTLQVSCCSSRRPLVSPRLVDQSKTSIPSSISFKSLLKEVLANPIVHNVSQIMKEASVGLADAFVDQTFEFIDQPLLSQSNFAPVDEIGEAVEVTGFVHGLIPDDFPEGVYIRNGPNPLFGGMKSTRSIFGQSSHIWVEGEGMLHAWYFTKDNNNGKWNVSYKNKQVETDTLKMEKQRNKPSFLPAVEGDSAAILSAYLLNRLRFGCENKDLSNTSVFEHSGKLYSAAENHIPQEIDIHTLETKRYWDLNGAWTRPFTSHPKKAPGTGELVIMGIYGEKPYLEVGVISADGEKLIHKVDAKLDRCCLCHEIGVTTRYNVILDFPLILDVDRLISGGPLIKYNKGGYARIGIMPRYGDAHSIKWFQVKPCCTFHILNCYEQDDEAVVVLACRSNCAIIPGPDFGLNKFEWFSKRFERILDEESQEESFLTRVYEWRLNMNTGEVSETNLTGSRYSMDFPMINEKFCGNMNSFGYTQVPDPKASSLSGMAKYGGLAKLHFKDRKQESEKGNEDLIKVEHHKFPDNTFCTGAAFVAKPGGVAEDDGWIITYVHDEDSNTSQVYIVDAKNFEDEPVAKIVLPRRVPYGFHGSFVPLFNS